MCCLSIDGGDILLLLIGQLVCHFHIVQSTQNATIIITGKTLGLELGLIAFLGCDLGGNGIDMV
jgi:hypothetical protein